MKMLKNTKNAVCAAAFEAFRAAYPIPEWEEMFAGGQEVVLFQIEEFSKVTRIAVQRSSQINDSTLRDMGFNPDTCSVRKMGYVNRQTKQLTPDGWI